MSIVAASPTERAEFDGFVEILRRLLLAKVPLPLIAAGLGVTDDDLTKGILRFLTSCQIAVETEAEISKNTRRTE